MIRPLLVVAALTIALRPAPLAAQPDAGPALRTAAPTVTGPLGIHDTFKVGMIVAGYERAIATPRPRGISFAMGPFPAREGSAANAILRDNEGNPLQVISG